MLSWIPDLLIDQNFCVHVGRSLPTCYSASSGVPQGSVLGPLFFVVIVNDLPGLLQSPSLMYADDIKMWRTMEGEENWSTLQADLNNLAQWAATWALPVITAECDHLNLGRTESEVVYNFQGTTLRRTLCEKNLGVLVTSSLKT
ncbi:unnamed protein product [Echinostoma caproni]|uniref:Reverse transcriptase domain-containing protein n=1 Tax=Echinostoma caproni TaxID=27848 RepID=A0A183AV69_9TREM|nr:unnamed protein product [Echinostoma caproni]